AYFASAMEVSKEKAVWAFVFADTPQQIEKFIKESGLALPVLRDPEARLSRSLDISKSGCFALVNVDGTVSAIWPGVSSPSLRDLLARLQISPSLAPNLPTIPQSPTAGCPL
ncbi:MAG: hypothetical protein EB090_06215, partial [Verrucomicrobia bacterium]|nr:hypothetical protein [Verrucomicrobiota bacterium]